MKKIALLMFTLLFIGTADLPAKKRQPAKTAPATTETAKKEPASKYKRTFQGKDCETVRGGFLTLHRTKGKLYFELPVQYIGRDLLIASTISEASDTDLGTIGYKPKPPMHVTFTRKDSLICLSEVNVAPKYDPNDVTLGRAMAKSTLDPILSTQPIFCYSPDSSAVVFEMTSLFTGNNDRLSPLAKGGAGVNITGSFNAKGSFLAEMKAFDDNVTIKSYMSYTVSADLMKLILLKKDEPMTFKVTRTILLLPEQKMRPRISDSRIGIFNHDNLRFSADDDYIKTYSMIHRWNLQPKDTAAWLRGELVEPVKPIVFYLDDAFPAAWAQGARNGVLRWNKAFEKIGFKNAIQVLDFPKDDPDFDPDNLKYSCIRYIPARVSNAMGPSWVDPRTGEIINASVLVFHDVAKLINQWRFVQTAQLDPAIRRRKMSDDLMTESLGYILAHEVGHTLGFMHNMAASNAFPVDSLRSASFTQRYGTTPSIMDYARFNYVAQPGDKGVKLTPPDLGVYDYYLVDYAYRPLLDAADEWDELPLLEALVDSHAGDPLYRYGRQQMLHRYDPTAIEEDLGDDPLKAASYGVKNLKYILAHLNEWITDEDDPDGAYRAMTYENIANQYDRYLKQVMLCIGGIRLEDLKAGAPGQRVTPTARETQQAALRWVIDQLKSCEWIENGDVTRNFNLRVGLAPILRYYTALELYNTLNNVILSAHVAGDAAYTPADYFDDLYQGIWASAIKGSRVPEADRMMQRLYIEKAVTVVSKKSQLIKVGLADDNSLAAASAPSVDHLLAFGLDPTGLVARYRDLLREYEAQNGLGTVARTLAAQDELGYGYGWQYRVNLRSIDHSKEWYHTQLIRVRTLLERRMNAVDADTKDHFRAMLYIIEEALAEEDTK